MYIYIHTYIYTRPSYNLLSGEINEETPDIRCTFTCAPSVTSGTVCIYIHIYIHIYVYVYIYMYIYIYIYKV